MPRVDLIPEVFPVTGVSIPNNDEYRSARFNIGRGMNSIGVTIKAGAALSVSLAYGLLGVDTAAASGTASSASLPYKTSATSVASNSTAAEGGTYVEITVPPMATMGQLVVVNASGGTVSSIGINAALRSQRTEAAQDAAIALVSANLAAEILLARNAANLTSGTIPAARAAWRGCIATRTANQAATTDTLTYVKFDSEIYKVAPITHSTSSDQEKFYCDVPGYLEAQFSLEINVASAGDFGVYVSYNGTLIWSHVYAVTTGRNFIITPLLARSGSGNDWFGVAVLSFSQDATIHYLSSGGYPATTALVKFGGT